MPIKPYFNLSQTETHLTITIHVPHIRVSASSIEVLIEGSEFHFYSSPYLLYLHFPGNIVDDVECGREAKARFEPTRNHGTVTIEIWKEESGYWKDLDLFGTLIIPPNKKTTSSNTTTATKNRPKITVLSSQENNRLDSDRMHHSDEDVDDEDVDADIPVEENLTNIFETCTHPRYGFLDMFHSMLTDFYKEGMLHDIVEITDPDATDVENRRELRLQTENQKFDPSRYLGDLYLTLDCVEEEDVGDIVYSESIRMIPHWKKAMEDSWIDTSLCTQFASLTTQQISNSHPQLHNKNDDGLTSILCNPTYFDKDELFLLSSIQSTIPDPNTIHSEQLRSLLLSLLDILFAYCYDHRTTTGDPTCESSWTISFLSPTLSWFDKYIAPYDSLIHVVRWCIRRALIYPYIRNYSFCWTVLIPDVIHILRQGRRTVLRCLLQVHNIFEKTERHYLLNQLYIDPYICWLQQWKEGDSVLASFSQEIVSVLQSQGTLLDKETLDLHLVEIELERSEEEGTDDNESSESNTATQAHCDDSIEENDNVTQKALNMS